MDISSGSSKRRPREKNRERSDRGEPSRPGRQDPRDPRTATTVDVIHDDYDDREYDNHRPRVVRHEDRRREEAAFGGDNQERGERPRPSKPPPKYSDKGRDERSSRGMHQPYVDDRRGRDDRQPYGRRRSEVVETTYSKTSDTSRPTSRYPPTRGRDRQEERGLGPEGQDDTAPLTAGLRDIRVEDDSHYALYPTVASPSTQYASPQGTSSYKAEQNDAAQAPPSTSYSSSQGRDYVPLVTVADSYRSTPAHSKADYRSTQADYPTTVSQTYHPEPFDSVQAVHTTSEFYPTQQNLSPSQPSYAAPAAPAYYSPPRDAAAVDTRQHASPATSRHQEAQQKLDESYKVRNHDYIKYFKVGRVFMTLWHDPLGSNANEQGSVVGTVIYGEKVYSKVRRFIVVRQGGDRRSATCLPIYSYGGNGQGKGGIKIGEHGFIYSKREPKKVPGMCSKALRVLISQNGQHLTDPSLVHYGKVHTVESNWKVKDIGVLDEDSIKTLLHYWRKVFGFVTDDLPEPGMTPLAKEAALAYVGTGVDSHPGGLGAYPPAAAGQQHFASTSTPAGYPTPASRESYGDTRGSAEYHYPQSTYPTTGHREYGHQSAHASSSYGTTSYQGRAPYYGDDPASNQGTTPAQGTASYQGYSVPVAPGYTVSYASQAPSTTKYYGQQHTATNPQAAGGTAYETYQQPHQVQQSWAPVGPTTASGLTDTYRYPTTGSVTYGQTAQYQDPSSQYPSGTGSTYPPQYRDSAIVEDRGDEIHLVGTVAEASQRLKQRERRESDTGDRRRRRDRDHRH